MSTRRVYRALNAGHSGDQVVPILNNVSIAIKLAALIVGSLALAALSLTAVNMVALSQNVQTSAEEKLAATSEARRDALRDYLGSIEQDIRTVATNPFTLDALQAFTNSWARLGADPQATLQKLYITDNPHPTGEKENLDAAKDGSAYSRAHATFHPWFRQFLRERGYYDIFLFSKDGDLVYSVFKELDYATNLRNGGYADTDLGGAFRAAADTLNAGELAFFDFKPYAPSHGAPASFISTPIPGPGGAVAGVLVFQMPIDQLNHVMASSAGLGETGEAFVVGEDGLMRTDAPRAGESTLLKTRVADELLGWNAFDQLVFSQGLGYRGADVVAAAAPLEFNGVRWRVVAQQDQR